MIFRSVCSGIEAATVAWHPLGWRADAFAEIEKFPSAVLAHHYPNVPNLGDMTKYKDWPNATFDKHYGIKRRGSTWPQRKFSRVERD